MEFEINKLDLSTLETEKTRWLPLGGIRLHIKLATPRDMDKFKRRMVEKRIIRLEADRIVTLDEERFRLEFAREFVIDWDGAIEPAGTQYTPELMAKAMASITGLAEKLALEVTDRVAFLETDAG